MVTVNFISPPVNNRENSFTGLSFQSGGYVNNNGIFTHEDGYGGYSVYNSHHWCFEGTNLEEGDILGYNEAIVYNLTSSSIDNKVNKITAYVFNNSDSTSICWNLVNSELAILSEPETFVFPKTYYFQRLNVFNYFNDNLKYSIKGPSWLSISNIGEIIGTSGSKGIYPVSVFVSNEHGQTDTVSFMLDVATTVPVELISFNGTLKKKSFFLELQTASEINNYGFEIQSKKIRFYSRGREQLLN